MFGLVKKKRAADAEKERRAHAIALAEAAVARSLAFKAHQDAKKAKDGEIGETRRALVRATHEKLRLEVRG